MPGCTFSHSHSKQNCSWQTGCSYKNPVTIQLLTSKNGVPETLMLCHPALWNQPKGAMNKLGCQQQDPGGSPNSLKTWASMEGPKDSKHFIFF